MIRRLAWQWRRAERAYPEVSSVKASSPGLSGLLGLRCRFVRPFSRLKMSRLADRSRRRFEQPPFSAGTASSSTSSAAAISAHACRNRRFPYSYSLCASRQAWLPAARASGRDARARAPAGTACPCPPSHLAPRTSPSARSTAASTSARLRPAASFQVTRSPITAASARSALSKPRLTSPAGSTGSPRASSAASCWHQPRARSRRAPTSIWTAKRFPSAAASSRDQYRESGVGHRTPSCTLFLL
jgi:hypothetical protein